MFGGVQMTAAAVGGWAEGRRGRKPHLKLPADPRSELPAANPLLQEETRVISILFSFLHISTLGGHLDQRGELFWINWGEE